MDQQFNFSSGYTHVIPEQPPQKEDPDLAPKKPYSASRYQNLPPSKIKSIEEVSHTAVQRVKPQISKEYASTLAVGKPDLSILEDNFEKGEHFYEPQFFDSTIDIPFRETESQIRNEAFVLKQTLRDEATAFYDSF